MARTRNSSKKLESVPPADLGLKETWVQDLVAERTNDILGEHLLVFSREYTGFSTRERPDILALDEDGNIVVVELKRGTAQEDAATQVVKYAAYCSQMKRADVIDAFEDYIAQYDVDTEGTSAQDQLIDFLGGSEADLDAINRKQRIILVANEFDKRVSAVAVWLYKNQVDIKCIRLRTYHREDGIILITPETYLPTPEIESYFDALRTEPADIQEQRPLEERIVDAFAKGLVGSVPSTLTSSPFNDRDVQVYPRKGGEFRVRMFGKNRAGYYFAKRWLRFYLYGPTKEEVRKIQIGASDPQSVNDKGYEVGFNVLNRMDEDLLVSVLRTRFQNRGEPPDSSSATNDDLAFRPN